MLDLERLSTERPKTWHRSPDSPGRSSSSGDYNGRVLSIRAVDLQALAVFYDCTPTELIERLADHQVLVADLERSSRAEFRRFCWTVVGRSLRP